MRICAAWLLKHAAPGPFRRTSAWKAAGFYERAVQLDPKFALAWARLSRADAILYFNRDRRHSCRSRRRSETCFGECAETGAGLA